MPDDKHASRTCGGPGICITCSVHINRHILRAEQWPDVKQQLSWTSRLDDLPVFRDDDKVP